MKKTVLQTLTAVCFLFLHSCNEKRESEKQEIKLTSKTLEQQNKEIDALKYIELINDRYYFNEGLAKRNNVDTNTISEFKKSVSDVNNFIRESYSLEKKKNVVSSTVGLINFQKLNSDSLKLENEKFFYEKKTLIM